MQDAVETKKVLIVVKTYPTPTHKSVESSCTAGVTEDGKWVRLFPIPYRLLDDAEKFHRYQWLEVKVTKPSSDTRAESYKLSPREKLKVLSEPLSTADSWRERREVLEPLRSHCMCCLRRQRKGGSTLGFFRPGRIEKLVIQKDKDSWTPEQLSILRQGDLFNKALAELEKIPFKFQYRFFCDHEPPDACNGHSMICTDWEMGEAWRNWKGKYGDGWEEKFRQKFETQMLEKYDTHFFVGTMHGHPDSWIIVGLFYPPKIEPGLFT